MRRKDTLFSGGAHRRGRRRDYRNASIGPDMGGYDAHGNTRTSRSVKKAKTPSPVAATAQQQGRTRPYTPGEIGYVRPRTASGETTADYARRRQRKVRSQRSLRDAPTRGIVLVVLAVVLALVVAGGVASCVFHGSVGSRLALQDTAVPEVLVKPDDADGPYYALLAGEFHDPAQPDDGPDVLMLTRVDAASGKATVISIPPNLIWTLTDGSNDYISRAQGIAGDAGLVKVVSDFAGVDIAHFAKVDAEGFVGLVDALGGIELDLSEEVDDPEAGDIYIPAGRQVLDGPQALTVCRAKNYLGSYEKRAGNQMEVLLALVRKAGSGSGFVAQQGTLDAISGNFQTDLAPGELSRLLGLFGADRGADVRMARVPGYSSYGGGELRFSVAPNAWKAMMEKVDAGGDPNEKPEALQSVNPSDHTLTVKNGSGVAGAANQVAEVLQDAGYRIEATGNTEQFAYGETLVVYKDDGDEVTAEAVIDELGVGRAVEAGIYYEFDTDLQVIVGQDWKPRA